MTVGAREEGVLLDFIESTCLIKTVNVTVIDDMNTSSWYFSNLELASCDFITWAFWFPNCKLRENNSSNNTQKTW